MYRSKLGAIRRNSHIITFRTSVKLTDRATQFTLIVFSIVALSENAVVNCVVLTSVAWRTFRAVIIPSIERVAGARLACRRGGDKFLARSALATSACHV